jgi:hypothetical protein
VAADTSSSGLSNNELQRTRDGNAAASPLNSVFDGPERDDGTERLLEPGGTLAC